MQDHHRPLAVVTGASSGIGLELACQCAAHGFDLVIAADRPIDKAALKLRLMGARATGVQADLSTEQGIDALCEVVAGRPVAVLIANAGHGLGQAFLDQEFAAARHVIDTNVTGTLMLVHRLGREMRRRGEGRILITGSIAGFMPGPFQAVYNATKAFIDSFARALRNELKDSGVSVTCLMPGPTCTDFFERAGLMDTKIAHARMAEPGRVAESGFRAMMDREGDVVTGLRNKIEVALANVTPAALLAEQHRRQTEPGSVRRRPQPAA
jgi:short-subunit dehydrogenase